MFNISLYINNKRVTLYPDENIRLNRSVQSLKDLTKVFTDFTKSFKVPANDTNNSIFKHWYDQQVINGFDARIKQPARIELGGITLVKGEMQLNSANLKNNIPTNYSIEFFGDTIKIKDLIGDDTLKDLDLSAYDHDYNATTIAQGFTSGLFNRDIKYPLLSYNRRYLWQDAQLDDESNINIKYNASFTSGLDWQELKPAIKCEAIRQAIETKYGLVFNNDFFARREWQDLYMSLGNGGYSPDEVARQEIDSHSVNVYQRPNTVDQFRPRFRATVTPVEINVEYRVIFLIDGQEVYAGNFDTGNQIVTKLTSFIPFGNYDFSVVIESKNELTFDITFEYFSRLYNFQGQFLDRDQYTNTQTALNIPSPKVNISLAIANIKITEWISAIIKAHNLVLEPQEDGNILVNDLNSWYNSGKIIDVTEHVDIETKQVERGKLYKEVDFIYEEQESLLADEYETQFGQQFGGVENTLLGIASEDKLEFKLPFENPQFERLLDSDVQYGYIVDNSLSSYKNKPFLMYIVRNTLTNPLGFTGDTYTSFSTVNLPTHAIDLDSGYTAQFNAEFNEYSGIIGDDNWFSRYYQDYINDMFNQQRRQITIKATLPINIATTLRLNDRLIIKDTRYLIDNLDTNLLTGVTKLVLINDIFETLNDNQQSSVSQSVGTFETEGSIFYSGADYAVVTTSSDWIALTNTFVNNGNSIDFKLAFNTTGTDRVGEIVVTDNLSNPKIIVLQK